MMSGYAGESLLRYRGSVASWTLLQKPFAPLTLVQRVREVLDGDRRATA